MQNNIRDERTNERHRFEKKVKYIKIVIVESGENKEEGPIGCT